MNNILLVRDSTRDKGEIPSDGYYATSPDIICHDQLAFPEKELVDNYDKADIGQPFKSGEVYNFIYSRVKNLSDTPQTAYIRLYHATASLFMHPDVWKNNVVKSMYSNKDYVKTKEIAAKQIGVATEAFGFDAGKSTDYCHVCIASTTDDEPVIPPFPTINDYVHWVHYNTNVSMRNFGSRVSEKAGFEDIKAIYNPYPRNCPVLIIADISGNMPKGTRIVMECEPLHIHSETVVQADETSFSAFGAGTILDKFVGIFKCYIYLPKGFSTTLIVTLRYDVERDRSNDVARELCASSHQLFDIRGRGVANANYGELLKVGQCTDIIEVVKGL